MDNKKIEEAVRIILEEIGEDPDRPGLKETPARVARMYREVFRGLNEPEFDDYKLFESGQAGNMVLVRDINFQSMCEHHLLPFYGKAHVAYIPETNQVIGLSKLPRLVEYCSARPSVQEDLTYQIGKSLVDNIPTKGVAVMLEGTHMCMSMRGVKTPLSTTKTYFYDGIFSDDRLMRQEFLEEIRN